MTSGTRRDPRLLDTYQPPEILGANGYWQDEDMEIDRRRKLIIGALDPRHDDVDQEQLPRHRARSEREEPQPEAAARASIVISYANPREPASRSATSSSVPAGHTTSCVDHCNYVWTGGPARPRRPRLPRPVHAGRARRRAPDLGHRHPRPGPPEDRSRKPIDLKRNDGATDYSHDVNVDAHGFAWVSGRGGLLGYATRGQWRDPRTDRVRRAQPWDPVLVAGGGLPGGDNGVAQPQTDFIHNASRPTDGRVRATGVRNGQRRPDDRGGLHDAVRPGRPDRRRGHHELARRRGSDELDAGRSRSG